MNQVISKILIVLVLILFSCNNNAQENKLVHKVFSNTDLPLKIKIGEQKKDSIPTLFYIPIEFEYTNNSNFPLEIKHTFWSKKSPNVRHSTVYFIHNEKFVKGIRTKYLKKREQKHYKSFVSFKFLLSKQEFKQLFKQEYKKNKVHNVKFSDDMRSFLNSRILEKGYIISIFYDLKSKKNFIKKTPIDF